MAALLLIIWAVWWVLRGDNTQIIGSRASGAVSDGGASTDNMGGLVGIARDNAQIIGSRASGTVSNGGAGTDNMGGLIGTIGLLAIVRDSSSSAMVCAATPTDCAAAGNGADSLGGLIGVFPGKNDFNDTKVHNCLATGAVAGAASEDRIGGFIGVIQNASAAELSANMTNNRFDTSSTTQSVSVGSVPNLDGTSDVAADLALLDGITGGDTAATQSATAYNSTWLATRWRFAATAYPQAPVF